MRLIYLKQLLALVLSIGLILTWPCGARADPLECSHVLNDAFGFGPLHRKLPDKIKAKAIRNKRTNNSFYTLAKDFASSYGRKYVDLVLSRLSSEGNTTVVIAMGGAEHLGTLLEFALIQNEKLRDRVDIKYIPLSMKIVRPYTAQNDESDTIRGIGPVPEGYKTFFNYSVDSSPLLQYLKSFKIFQNSKVLVLDTGFYGTIPGVIDFADSKELYTGQVEGVLISATPYKDLKTPIFSLNQTLQLDPEMTSLWARRLDGNNEQGAEGNEHVFVDAFQRSYQSQPTFHKRNIEVKNIVYDLPQEVLAYKATLLGLQDSLSSHQPP